MAKCVSDGCIHAYKPHRWGKQKAKEDGWFFQRDGRAWCPEHIPDWVRAWRIRQYKKHPPLSSPIACRTCGRSGTHHCVVGKVGSPIWKKQIPLYRWHSTRLDDYKKYNAEHAKETLHE